MGIGEAEYTFMGSITDRISIEQWLITLETGNSNVKFCIDTGAEESVIPEQVYNGLSGVGPLRKADKKLRRW